MAVIAPDLNDTMASKSHIYSELGAHQFVDYVAKKFIKIVLSRIQNSDPTSNSPSKVRLHSTEDLNGGPGGGISLCDGIFTKSMQIRYSLFFYSQEVKISAPPKKVKEKLM